MYKFEASVLLLLKDQLIIVDELIVDYVQADL